MRKKLQSGLLWLPHFSRTCPKRQKLSVKDTLFVMKTAERSWLSVHNTRGTSGVSLFLLNPQGASVYHVPKYEPIFSITLSLQRKPSASPGESVKKNGALHYVVSQYLKSPWANLLAKWFHDSQALGAAYVAKVAALNKNWPVVCGSDMRSPHAPLFYISQLPE